MAEEMGDRFPHRLFKDAEVDAHFGCTAEARICTQLTMVDLD